MMPSTELSRTYDIAGAAAKDINNEMFIIAGALIMLIEATAEDDPLRTEMLMAHKAAQRCIVKAAGLMNFAARHGMRPSNATMERLIEMAENG